MPTDDDTTTPEAPTAPADGQDATPTDTAPVQPGAGEVEHRAARRRFVAMLLVDIAAPLAVFYGLRWMGVNQWWALIVAGVIPVARLGYTAIHDRRLEKASAFTLTLLVIGTGIGLLTGDPRLLLARESYLTGVVGAWSLITLLAARPLMFTATIPFLPAPTAQAWQQDWHTDRVFRRALRVMTAGWGLAFLLDAAARVLMAYTLPLDWVPVLSIALLLVMLTAVVQGTKAWGRHRPPNAGRAPSTTIQPTR